MPADTLSFQRVVLLEASNGRNLVLDRPAARPDEHCMHSILLVIPKPENDQPGTGQAWKAVAPGLRQRALQAGCVKMLYENCWLIPAETEGWSFFDHAITVADEAGLRCRICVLRMPHPEFGRRSPHVWLKRLHSTIVRTFQGAVRFFP